MKKIFYSFFAFAAMFAASSCSQDDEMAEVQEMETVEATFEVKTPEMLNTRAIGDGTAANVVVCAVFDDQQTEKRALRDTVAVTNKAATYKVRLVKGQDYRIVFFAINKDANAYDLTNMDNIKVRNAKANIEGRDAFTNFVDVTADETLDAIKETVQLYRPFAQLNIGANDDDVAAAKAAGVELANTKVVISDVYTAFNAYTDEVTGATSEIAFDFNSLPEEKLKAMNSEFVYLAMNYILVGNKGQEKTLSDVKFSWNTANGNTNDDDPTVYTNVPLRRNYRTNLVGWILTSPAEFNIEIKEAFEGDKDEEYTEED